MLKYIHFFTPKIDLFTIFSIDSQCSSDEIKIEILRELACKQTLVFAFLPYYITALFFFPY